MSGKRVALVCPGCVSREAEIVFLRAQVEKLMDRAFPTATAQPQTAMPVSESWTDDHGVTWITYQGRSMKLDDYYKVLQGQGAIDHTGSFIPNEELERVAKQMDRVINGQPLS